MSTPHKKTTRLVEAVNRYFSEHTPPEYVRMLWQEFVNRNTANPRYSLRAYSRDLNLDPGHLTRVLTGKRVLRSETAQGVQKRLALDESVGSSFVNSAYHSCKRRGKKRGSDKGQNTPLS